MELINRFKRIIFIFLILSIILNSFIIAFAALNGFIKDWGVVKDNESLVQGKVDNKPPYKGIVLKPKAIYIGTNTVVLKPQKNYEYLVVLSGVNVKYGVWQASNKFYFLKPNTEYNFYQRVKETDHHLKSSVSEKLTLKTKDYLYNGMYYNWLSHNQNNDYHYPSFESNSGEVLNDGNEKQNGITIAGDNSYGATLNAFLNNKNPASSNDNTYQWQRDNEDIPNANKDSYELTHEDIGKKIRVIVSNNSQKTISEETQEIEKADNSDPSKPKASNVTDSAITLEPKQGYEYGITKDNKTQWQNSNEFNYLSPGTRYELSQRIKETNTHKPSQKSSNIVITKFRPMGYDIQKQLNQVKKQSPQENENIFNGVDTYITRAEMSMLIVKALGLIPKENYRFEDIKPNTIMAKYIGTAYSYGIIAGTSETTFSPNELVTKEDALVMLKRVSRILNIIGTIKNYDNKSFIDYNDISDYAKESVIWGISNSIIDIKFNEILPKNNIIKSQAVRMINRLLYS